MLTMRSRFAAAMLVVVTAASCLLDADEDGDPNNFIPIDQIEQAFKDANCTYLARCGLFPDKAECLAAELSSGAFALDPNIIAAVGKGRVYYNGSNIKACVDAYAARSCDRTSESARVRPAECYDIIRGTVMGNEPCTIDAECVSGTCTSGSDTCQFGLCIGDAPPPREPAALGEPCSTLGCVRGAYCDEITNECTPLKGTGELCTLDSECAYGLGCTWVADERACAPLPTVGQQCTTDGVCRDEGTFCDLNTGLCTQYGLAGATCSSSAHCSPSYPCDFSTSMCTRGPSLGEPCSGVPCFDAGTFCDTTTATCTALRADGELCIYNTECQSEFCDYSSGGSSGICTSPLVCI